MEHRNAGLVWTKGKITVLSEGPKQSQCGHMTFKYLAKGGLNRGGQHGEMVLE